MTIILENINAGRILPAGRNKITIVDADRVGATTEYITATENLLTQEYSPYNLGLSCVLNFSKA